MSKELKIYHQSRCTSLSVEANLNLPSTLRRIFGLNDNDEVTLFQFDPVTGTEIETFIVGKNWYDCITDGGHYAWLLDDEHHIYFRSSPTSPLTLVKLGELTLPKVKKAMLEAYGYDAETSCEICQEVQVPGHSEPLLTKAVTTPKELKVAAKGKLRLVIDSLAPLVSGPEIGVRNLIELAAKLLYCYGTVGNARKPIAVFTAISDMLEGGTVPENSGWVMAMLNEIPELVTDSVWDQMKTTYSRTSQEVAHISYNTSLPVWEEITADEAIEIFSPTRKTVKESQTSHVNLAVRIIRYLEGKGLVTNMVLAAYFLKTFRHDATSPELIYEIKERGPLYLPFKYLDRTVQEIYVMFVVGGKEDGGDLLKKWAQMHLAKTYSSNMPRWG